MRKEVSPAVFWLLLGGAAVVIVVIGFRMLSSSSAKMDTTGSDKTIKQFQTTGKFYQPPAGAPVPGASSSQSAQGSIMPPGAPGR